MTTTNTVEAIKGHHHSRRYAVKVQQKIDRALESFIRINTTEWSYDAGEADREKFNREVAKIIAAARKNKGDKLIIELVQKTDRGREPFDAMRKAAEKEMEKLATDLPVAPWVESVRGAGMFGLATIIAETGDLSNYPNVAKVWKRLGFAPFDGHAGSTWKRETWRPRKLTKEEWIENPFSGERYALIHQSAVWLRNAQWIGKAKTDDGVGKPNGPYGEIYAARRAHTSVTHPDWSDGHADKDALRIMMKEFLKDLWVEWRKPTAVQAVVAPAPKKSPRAGAAAKPRRPEPQIEA